MEEVVGEMTGSYRFLSLIARRPARVLLALLLSSLVLSVNSGVASSSSGQGTSSLPVAAIGDLVGRAGEMDGSQVRIVGEAVGDLMVRGDHAWLNVLDASGLAIGVYLPKAEALKVRVLGGYSQKGDAVDLTGVFHSSCSLHDGEPDIHADSLVRVQEGGKVQHPVSSARMALSGLLLGLALLMGIAVRRRDTNP